MTDRTRYALVGTGHRAQMYVDAITDRFADRAELVAWSDTNPGRLDFYEELLAGRSVPAPARYEPDRLASMIEEQEVDAVVVTSPDVTHAPVIVACLQAGADVVVEKPLTIDAAGCAAHRGGGGRDRPAGRGDLQLPLLAAQLRVEAS